MQYTTFCLFHYIARRAVFILVALIFFSIDSLALLFLVLNTESIVSFLMEIAFHGWILYYLINGVRAWAKIRGIHKDIFNAILKESRST
jgi:hypothetical protein